MAINPPSLRLGGFHKKSRAYGTTFLYSEVYYSLTRSR